MARCAPARYSTSVHLSAVALQVRYGLALMALLHPRQTQRLLALRSAAVGIYTVTVTNGCGSASAATAFALGTPTITITADPASCGDLFTLSATGASSYVWEPAAELSCSSCGSPTTTHADTYTVTGTTAGGCTAYGTLAVGGNRISGYVTFSGAAPDSLDLKVWLIQFNPADSSLTAIDSTITCISGGMPYYEFAGEACGQLYGKSRIDIGRGTGKQADIYPLTDFPVLTGIPAATIAHTSGFDTLHIRMVYGTVTAGTGFIGGLVGSGADRNTSTGVPVEGMLIYLKNATTNHILTYTYTDATGAYAFPNLANGSYSIFPEDYQYTTIVSPAIALTASSDSVNGVNFMQHTVSKTITPASELDIHNPSSATGSVNVYPNPTNGALTVLWSNVHTGAADIIVTDVAGQEVFRSPLNIAAVNGRAQLDLSNLKEGIYLVTIRGTSISFTDKITIEQ